MRACGVRILRVGLIYTYPPKIGVLNRNKAQTKRAACPKAAAALSVSLFHGKYTMPREARNVKRGSCAAYTGRRAKRNPSFMGGREKVRPVVGA